MSEVRSETLEMVAEWRKRDAALFEEHEHEPDDFLDRWLPAAADLLDAGWNGYGIAPSETLKIRYCMLMTPVPSDREYAQRVAHWIKAEATRRHQADLHPYPLTNERPSVTAGEMPSINP